MSEYFRPEVQELEDRELLSAYLPGPAAPEWVVARAWQDDGKIIVVGSLEGDFAVSRLHADGSLDLAFGGAGVARIDFAGGRDLARGLAITPAGQIVVVGWAAGAAGDNDFAVARLNSDGSLDAAFGGSGRMLVAFDPHQDERAWNVLLQPDGKIVVAGSAQSPLAMSRGDLLLAPWAPTFVAARLNGDGSLDETFGSDGKVAQTFGQAYVSLNDMKLQSDGKIVIVGTAGTSTQGYLIARFNEEGTLDAAFASAGSVLVGFHVLGGSAAFSLNNDSFLTLLPDGTMEVTGRFFASQGEFPAATIKVSDTGLLQAFLIDGQTEVATSELIDGETTSALWVELPARYEPPTARPATSNNVAVADVLYEMENPQPAGELVEPNWSSMDIEELYRQFQLMEEAMIQQLAQLQVEMARMEAEMAATLAALNAMQDQFNLGLEAALPTELPVE